MALAGKDHASVPESVDHAVFRASVRFAHRHYLAGQASLAVSAKENIWAGRELPHVVLQGDRVPMPVRILCGSPGSYITLGTFKSIDFKLRRHLHHLGTPLHAAAARRLEQLWRACSLMCVSEKINETRTGEGTCTSTRALCFLLRPSRG